MCVHHLIPLPALILAFQLIYKTLSTEKGAAEFTPRSRVQHDDLQIISGRPKLCKKLYLFFFCSFQRDSECEILDLQDLLQKSLPD